MHEVFPVRFAGIADESLLLGVLRQEAADSGGSQVEGFAGIGVELHLDGFLTAAVNVDRGDPVDVFQVGPYLFLH